MKLPTASNLPALPNPARRALFVPGLMSLLAPALLADRTRPAEEITVGALLSLTGDWSDLGKQCKLMLEIGTDELEEAFDFYNAGPPFLAKFLRGVRFNLLIEDTQL